MTVTMDSLSERLLVLETEMQGLKSNMQVLLASLGSKEGKPDESTGKMTLAKLTAKQHIVLQMLFTGATNVAIANRLGVEVSTAKTHVRSLARRYKCDNRSMLCLRASTEFEAIEEATYKRVAYGVPKNWAELYLHQPVEADPFKGIYSHEREEQG